MLVKLIILSLLVSRYMENLRDLIWFCIMLDYLLNSLMVDVSFQVVTPTGNVLVDNLTLRVESGSNLLITGSLVCSMNCNLCHCILF